MTVFCNPTRDVIAKYLLDDEEIRNSCIRALTPYKDVTSSRKLDNALRPLKLDQNLLNILGDPKFAAFLQGSLHTVNRETPEQQMVLRFLTHLQENYEEIRSALLDDKAPVSDVICKLSTGDHVLIEIQVVNPGGDAWDKRALAYAAMLYGNQLRRGQSWPDIQSVMALNILGTGYTHEPRPFWPEGFYYKRHYRFENTLLPLGKARANMDYIELIQYSLGNTDLGTIEHEEERAWLDFFTHAHTYDHTPLNCPEIVRLAYERVKTDHVPPNIHDLYKSQDAFMDNYRIRIQEDRQEAREEGKAEGEIKGKVKTLSEELGLSAEAIAEKAGIPLETVREILAQG
jgi:predicted transposase/invertase (TIGR01784 family)